MEDDLLLNRPSDRRVLDDKNIYPGPPGAENDGFDGHGTEQSKSKQTSKKESGKTSTGGQSKPRDRKSRSRSRERERVRRSRSRSFDRRNNRSRRQFGGPAREYNREKNTRRSRERSPRRMRTRSRERSRGRETSRDRNRYRRGGGRRTPSSPNRNRWSPKDGQGSNQLAAPPPPMLSQQAYPHMFNEGYNYGGGVMNYGANQPAYNSYDSYGAPQNNNFAPTYPPPPILNQPIPPGDDFPAQQTWGPPPPQIISQPVATTQQPIQPAVPAQIPASEEDKIKREAAVALEMQNQRAQLKKQRADYQKRASALKRELKILKEQRDDLNSGSEPPSPTTKGFIKENDRLQSQIQNKLNTIENVIDMLSGIIGKESVDRIQSDSPSVSRKTKESGSERDSSPEILKTKLIESMHKSKSSKGEKETKAEKIVEAEKPAENDKNEINYVHYDPEMHWCKSCDMFPKTAKDYLNHLHSKEHCDKIKGLDEQNPWHSLFKSDELPNYPNAPTKRTPIRGLQFFVPSSAWYCKLCAIWMGDLKCASLHLKSKQHAETYNEYIEQNPHFEVDWMADRQKAYEKSRDTIPQAPAPPSILPTAVPASSSGLESSFEGIPLQIKQTFDDTSKKSKKTKLRNEIDKDGGKRDKKRKKKNKKRRHASSSSSDTSSSSDSSDSGSEPENPVMSKLDEMHDKSNSIRVAMRNLLKSHSNEKQEETGRWTVVQPGIQSKSSAGLQSAPNMMEKKKDELIQHWATPESVITESEKKLFEDLKGKLKKKTMGNEKEEVNTKNNDKLAKKPVDDKKDVPREKRDSRERSGRDTRDRFRDNRDRRDRSRDRERDFYDRRDRRRRSTSRGRTRRSRSRSPMHRRYRRRQMSRSRSRSRSRVIEKPVVNYPPEPKPRVEKKIRSRLVDDSKRSPNSKKNAAAKHQNITGKKLPFIGRMPVFKKQITANENEKKIEIATNGIPATTVEPHAPTPAYTIGPDGVPHMLMEDDDDLMPDPAQLMAIMANAPPPPPVTPMPIIQNELVLPPGIDENEADMVPKPISDAPRPRKGPLPKDFQDALNIIFPGEKKPDETPVKVDKPEITIEIINEPPTNMTVEELSQHGIEYAYPNFTPQQIYGMYEPHPGADLPLDILPVPPPPPAEAVSYPIEQKLDLKPIEENNADMKSVGPEVLHESTKKESQPNFDLDELAMLGIDADDLAAQCM